LGKRGNMLRKKVLEKGKQRLKHLTKGGKAAISVPRHLQISRRIFALI